MTNFGKIHSTKWIGLLIYPFFVCITLSTTTAQVPSAYQQVLNLEWENAQKSIERNDQSPIPFFDLYIENLSEILELFFSEDEARFEELTSNEKRRIRIIRAAESDSPYHRFLEAEIKMQWAFIKLKFGEQWSAAWTLRSAYRVIRRNIREYPEFELNQKSMGLLHIIFGAVPSKHQWLLGLFGLEGDVMLGLEELQSIAQDSSSLFSTEAGLIGALVNSYLLEDHKAALAQLDINRDLTIVETFVSSLVLMKAHEAMKARTLLLGIHEKQPLFLYLIAETYFQEGDYTTADDYYRSFLEKFRGINNIKDAYFKSSLCALFLNDLDTYNSQREKAKALGKDYSEVDKNAADLLNQTGANNQLLLQLRFAMDGGFYPKADSLINEIQVDQLNHYDLIHLKYRKARLNHLQGNIDQAIAGYGEIIQSDNIIPETYFAPNSLLQLGHIYLERGENDKAKMYLERVLKFRKHPYKTSLDSKARIALSKIKE